GGVGTEMITPVDQPARGAVYKLVSIENEHGEMVDTIKISGNPEKVTTPSMKKLYRIVNTINNRAEGDYITLENEYPNEEEKLKMFHPIHTYISKFVTNFNAINLHHVIFMDGKLVYENHDLFVMKEYSKEI